MEQNSRFITLAFRMWREVKENEGAQPPAHLLAAVASVPSADWDDLTSKLALWRWVHDGLNSPDAKPAPADKLVYSIYRDALRLANKPDYAQVVDDETDFFAEMLSDARAA
ncbi:hypothetical protein L2D00_04270 [Hyphomonadaceae bacterium BL14]|nr:hypothetical protein L2D00_04270 [Hyphomonadaceae bacterium BL14]